MKRKNEKVPEFDEIIFENRNKNYGAYYLRKCYKSATTFSILGGSVFFTVIMLAISLKTEEGSATSGLQIVAIEMSDPLIQVDVPEPAVKPPDEIKNTIKNLQPKVVSDTSEVDEFIPITEEINEATTDGIVTEEVIIAENPEPEIPAETKPFIVVEEPPEYPGGTTALLKYISENLIYPPVAQENNIQGRVILKFVVNSDGSADRIEILRSIDPLLDNEAMRVVSTLPRFKPGKQGGVPVPVWFTLPVVFKINNR
jgi:protein TonB